MPEIHELVTGCAGEIQHAVLCLSAQWFAIYTAARHEKHVAQSLKDRRIVTFLPSYQATRRWKNRCQVTLDLPLFPGYVFVRMEHRERGGVLAVPGVLSIVGSGREAWPMPDFEIEAMRSALRSLKFEPHPYLVIGERARIKAGPLAGMEGVLIRKKDNLRVVLTLDQIMQSVAVEVEADDLEPVRPRTSRMAMAGD